MYLEHLSLHFDFIISSTVRSLVPRRIECTGLCGCLIYGVVQRRLRVQRPDPADEVEISALTSLHMTLPTAYFCTQVLRHEVWQQIEKLNQWVARLLQVISRPTDGLRRSGLICESVRRVSP